MENKEIEISVEKFEKLARKANRKFLARSILSMAKHYNEYIKEFPAGLTNECSVEITIDKSAIDRVLDILKSKGYKIIGTKNLLQMEATLTNLRSIKNPNDKIKEMLNKAEKEYEEAKKNNQEYLVNEDDDAKFLVSPIKEGVSNLIEFISDINNEFKEIAGSDDLTILLYVSNVLDNLKGLIGYNFIEEKDGKEEIIDFYTTFNINVDFRNNLSIFYAGYASSGLVDNVDDLDFFNLKILAKNLNEK